MANMSYCRLQNTRGDLQDCLDSLEEGGLEELSREELFAAERLVKIAEEIVRYGDAIQAARKAAS